MKLFLSTLGIIIDYLGQHVWDMLITKHFEKEKII